MNFLYPSLLWLLFPLAILLWTSRKNTIAFIHSFILTLILLSLSRPIEHQVLVDAKIQSKDILIAIDVSYSMRATDLKPNRYDFAKETISALLLQNPSDNVMLIAFTTNPLLLSPPTTDHPLIHIALKSLNPEFILTKGTSLKRLFAKIATLDNGYKEVILLSDGGEEKLSEALIQSIEQSPNSLHIVALGTIQGTTISHKDHTLLKDKEGNLVISRINPMLKILAHRVNATYIETSSRPIDTAKTLDTAINNNQKKQQLINKKQKQHKELYTLPLLIALLLFLFLHTRAIKYIILFLALIGIQAEASFMDRFYLLSAYYAYENKSFISSQEKVQKIKSSSLQSHTLLAHSLYKQGKYKEAIKVYHSISSSSLLIKQQNYYHIANAYTLLEKYTKAKIYYSKALNLGEDKDARHNLNLIALRKDKDDASLGIAHPKSQSDNSTKSDTPSSKESKNEEDNPSSSNSGSGEGNNEKNKKNKAPQKLLSDDNKEEQPHPLGSKVYELINKGYIRETRPW